MVFWGGKRRLATICSINFATIIIIIKVKYNGDTIVNQEIFNYEL